MHVPPILLFVARVILTAKIAASLADRVGLHSFWESCWQDFC